MKVIKDYRRDGLFDELGLKRLRESYMLDSEKSPQDRLAFVSETFSSSPDHAQRLYDYASKHWLSYSTPILAYGRSKKALPISCYLNYIDDTTKGLIDNLSETNLLSTLGGGVGIGFGIRSVDEKSVGVIPHLKTYDMSTLAYKQGQTRRGSYAAYLDISHPEIVQFIEMRKSTGDANMRCHNLHHGVNITDKFMHIIERCMEDKDANDDWPLIDPHSKEVKSVVSAKWLWEKLLETRMQGEPYILFIDTANDSMPWFLDKDEFKIRQSNLCTEIMLPTSRDRTAICCLSSLNVEYFDEWKHNDIFIKDVARMLDNVLNVFIKDAPPELHRAILSAKEERNIGIGQLGFHSYLQKNNIPFESAIAKSVNIKIAKHISLYTDLASRALGIELGYAPAAYRSKDRFCHTTAIAPNASSSIIMGNTSPSVEPYRSNVFRQDTLSGSHTHFNKYLLKLIYDKSEGNEGRYSTMIKQLVEAEGSVQGLDFFDDYEKSVFKTAMEIDQRWIIELAADRQQYIDQGQSINLFFRPTVNIKYLHAVHFMAWKKGLKSLYYVRSDKIRRADKVSQAVERKIIDEIDLKTLIDEQDCIACEG